MVAVAVVVLVVEVAGAEGAEEATPAEGEVEEEEGTRSQVSLFPLPPLRMPGQCLLTKMRWSVLELLVSL